MGSPDRMNELAKVVIPSFVTEFDRLNAGKSRQCGRHILLRGYRRLIHQNRYDTNVAFQSLRNFKPDKVLRIINPPSSGRIPGLKPSLADKYDHDVASNE